MSKLLENAHKVAYLVKMYPEMTTDEIVKLMQVPPVEVNASIWKAQELDILNKEIEDGKIVFGTAPKSWQFGDNVKALEDAILYCFSHLAGDETDLDELFMTEWLTGYPAQDSLIAVNHLLATKKLAEYNLTDESKELGRSVYRFYTLPENKDKLWGQRNFSEAPRLATPEEVAEARINGTKENK